MNKNIFNCSKWKQAINLFRTGETPKSHDGNLSNVSSWENLSKDDLFLVSFPRSGNTWLRYLMTNMRFPNANWTIQSLSYAFPEIMSPIDYNCIPEPRWIKSHSGFTDVYSKVIYLFRDPRDVAVSFYFWSGKNKSISIDEFTEKSVFGKDNPSNCSWSDHVKGWNKKSDNIIWIKYEELVDDTEKVLEKIAKFVGINPKGYDINSILEKSTLQKQQKDFKRTEYFRNKKVGIKGGYGSNNEYMSSALRDSFKTRFGHIMKDLGYD